MCARYFRRHAVRVVAVSSIAAASVGYVGAPAGADQLSSLRAQAQSVAARIQGLGQQEDGLSEQFDAATLAVQSADARVTQAGLALAGAQRAAGAARATLGQEALAAYTGDAAAPSFSGAGSLGTATAGLLGAEYVNSLAASQQDALDQYHLATVQARTAQATLGQARTAAQARVTELGRARSSVEATQTQLEAVEGQDQGQIATLVAQIQAAQLAAEQAQAARAAQARAASQAAAEQAASVRTSSRAAAPASPTPAVDLLSPVVPAAAVSPSVAKPTATAPSSGSQSSGSQAPGSSTSGAPSSVSSPVPAVGHGAAGAVQAALSRVGDPYVWGAAGPDSFDCSGLVMWAYAQAGISLPHYSGAQYADGVSIPMSDLEPGDLVFFSNPGQHVAMYIGGGEIVEAPHTGADVHVVPMYSEFVLAVRIA